MMYQILKLKQKMLENLSRSDSICGDRIEPTFRTHQLTELTRLFVRAVLMKVIETRNLGSILSDVEMPALDWGKHSKKSHNTRLKSNRFICSKCHELSEQAVPSSGEWELTKEQPVPKARGICYK